MLVSWYIDVMVWWYDDHGMLVMLCDVHGMVVWCHGILV